MIHFTSMQILMVLLLNQGIVLAVVGFQTWLLIVVLQMVCGFSLGVLIGLVNLVPFRRDG